MQRLSTEVSALRQELSILQRSAETESNAHTTLAMEHQKIRSAYIIMREKFEKSQSNAHTLGIVAYALQVRVRESNRGIQQLVSLTRKLEEESKMALRTSRPDKNRNTE